MTDLPPAFVARMHALLGDEASALVAAIDAPPVRGGRINPRKFATIDALARALEVELTPSPFHCDGFVLPEGASIGAHPLHSAGAYYLQEPSATFPVTVLDPQPGERILDLCAAPGGKSTAIAAALQGQGVLIGNDVQWKRSRALGATIDRWGSANAAVTNEAPERLANAFGNVFDRVLVDAPCSGEGLFRREPEARREWTDATVTGCARRQRDILHAAADLVAPEGVLVYSTCTFETAENEHVVEEFLTTHPDWELEPIALVGGASQGSLAGTARVYPHHAAGEGQFVARLRAPAGHAASVRRTRVQSPPRPVLDAWNTFARATVPGWNPPGPLALFGDTLVACADTPPLDGLAVVRAGLPLGWLRHSRFEPSTALAHAIAIADAAERVELAGVDLGRYVNGEPVARETRGWTLVTVDGVALGWGRANRNVMRSAFPAAWRQWVRTRP